MSPKVISIIVFTLTYCLFILLPNRRTVISIIASLLLIFFSSIPLKEVFFSINWNVIAVFVGMLVIADIFMESGMPGYIAEQIINKSKNTATAVLFLCVFTGLISAFVENVATVLIMAPIAFSLSKKINIKPVNLLIAIAISSNLQGTATLIGDPPSMLLAGFAKMNFMNFFFYRGKPSIFFAVEVGAVFSLFFLYLFFINSKEKVFLKCQEKIKSWVPTIILIMLIVCLAISSFLDTGFNYLAGVLCIVFCLVSLIWDKVFNKSQLTKRIYNLDWDTTFFLISIFIIIGVLTYQGWIVDIANYLSVRIGNNLFLGYTVLVFVSVAVSAFVDNVPFLAAMLPVAITMSKEIGVQPQLFLFGLLIGSSLGGNITPIGASANIVACGLLKKEGYRVTFGEFCKIGLPFTISAVVPAYIFIWLIWKK